MVASIQLNTFIATTFSATTAVTTANNPTVTTYAHPRPHRSSQLIDGSCSALVIARHWRLIASVQLHHFTIGLLMLLLLLQLLLLLLLLLTLLILFYLFIYLFQQSMLHQ